MPVCVICKIGETTLKKTLSALSDTSCCTALAISALTSAFLVTSA